MVYSNTYGLLPITIAVNNDNVINRNFNGKQAGKSLIEEQKKKKRERNHGCDALIAIITVFTLNVSARKHRRALFY